MPDLVLATPCTQHECVGTCVTIYLTQQNVYTGAYMCTPQGNDDAPAFNLLN